MDEEEVIYALMMDALDGELAEAEQATLEAHLRARPELDGEWRLMCQIDGLLRETPVVSPPPGFVAATMARLPAPRPRVVTQGIAYALLLLAGVLPVVGIIWVSARLAPSLMEPAVWRGLGLATTLVVDTVIGLFGAFSRILLALGQQASQQPGVWGWLFVMMGLIALWGGVVQVLGRQPAREAAR